MAKKTTKPDVEIDKVLEENAFLRKENDDLLTQVDLFKDQVIAADKKYFKERDERRDLMSENEALKLKVIRLTAKICAQNEKKDYERKKRLASIPKFVIISAVALLAIIVEMELQKLNVIWPSLGFGIQCVLAMVIAWCYAIVWDRSRK